MKHINYQDEIPEEITAAGASGVTLRTVIGRKDGAPNFDMRVISFAPGGQSPNHSHDYEHEIYVFKGRGSVEIDGKQVEVSPGDVVYVPANAAHHFKAEDGMEMI